VIKLEGGVLVLDAPISKKDAEAVGEFAKHVREQEQERIIKLLESVEGHGWIEIQFDKLIELIEGETK
jgi:hypothetical protein